MIYVSGTSHFAPIFVFSLPPDLESDGNVVLRALGTLKHAQIAAVEWNREAIARVKAGVNVYGALGCRVSSCLVLMGYVGVT